MGAKLKHVFLGITLITVTSCSGEVSVKDRKMPSVFNQKEVDAARIGLENDELSAFNVFVLNSRDGDNHCNPPGDAKTVGDAVEMGRIAQQNSAASIKENEVDFNTIYAAYLASGKTDLNLGTKAAQISKDLKEAGRCNYVPVVNQ